MKPELSPSGLGPLHEIYAAQREIWDRKTILRRMYEEEFFSRIVNHALPCRPTLEIGSGIGSFGAFAPKHLGLRMTDIVPSPWVEAAVDAQALPFGDSTLANIVGLDVLHHMGCPAAFFEEVNRTLFPGGRLVLVEPWVTPLSFIVYRWFHQEDLDLGVPSVVGAVGTEECPPQKHPFDANIAIPYKIFVEEREQFEKRFPQLGLVKMELFSFFTYLATLGFRRRSLIPLSLYGPLMRFERATEKLWRRLAALRVLIVIERKAGTLL